MKNKLSIFEATPQNIWNYRQNHPELVIRDIEENVNNNTTKEDIVSLIRQSMLCRGINKWLKVRRDLIAYKKQIRNEIKLLNYIIPLIKENMSTLYCNATQVNNGTATVESLCKYYEERIRYEKEKSKLKILNEIRRDLKTLCMTDRWQIWKDKKIEDMNTIKESD